MNDDDIRDEFALEQDDDKRTALEFYEREARTKLIADLNDQLRTTLDPRYGRVLMTCGVEGSGCVDEILQVVKTYDFLKADPGNDPYSQRDFGAFELLGTKYFFKVDYYDKQLQYHSPDETDPKVTTRVLTILRADEY